MPIFRDSCCRFVFVVILAIWGGTLVERTSAADMVRIRTIETGQAVGEETLSGKIREITTTSVELIEEGKSRLIPANVVIWTQFDREPINLTTARTLMQSAQYAEAIGKLGEMSAADQKNLAPPVRQEIDFIMAVGTGMLALTRQNEPEYLNAGKLLTTFLNNYPQSYHVTEVTELIGNILLAMKKLGNARTYFERLAEMPWPDVRLKALLASGTIALEEGKVDEARKNFNAVLSFNSEESALIKEQQEYAQIGLAQTDLSEKKFDSAAKTLKELVVTGESNSPFLRAKLYNTLGESLVGLGETKAAILAYLHTDLLYSTAKVEHVTALRQLYQLWKKDYREDRAAEVSRTLREEYKITTP